MRPLTIIIPFAAILGLAACQPPPAPQSAAVMMPPMMPPPPMAPGTDFEGAPPPEAFSNVTPLDAPLPPPTLPPPVPTMPETTEPGPTSPVPLSQRLGG